jgi:hypothetical protein
MRLTLTQGDNRELTVVVSSTLYLLKIDCPAVGWQVARSLWRSHGRIFRYWIDSHDVYVMCVAPRGIAHAYSAFGIRHSVFGAFDTYLELKSNYIS